jgi:hypothetical protein
MILSLNRLRFIRPSSFRPSHSNLEEIGELEYRLDRRSGQDLALDGVEANRFPRPAIAFWVNGFTIVASN